MFFRFSALIFILCVTLAGCAALQGAAICAVRPMECN